LPVTSPSTRPHLHFPGSEGSSTFSKLEAIPSKHSIPTAPWTKLIASNDERITAVGHNPKSSRTPIHKQNLSLHIITSSFFLLEVTILVPVERPCCSQGQSGQPASSAFQGLSFVGGHGKESVVGWYESQYLSFLDFNAKKSAGRLLKALLRTVI
jgi:hypothetical protein